MTPPLLELLTVLLIFSDVALSAAVFVLVARPDVGVVWALRRSGLGDVWFEDDVSPEEIVRLRGAARAAGGLGLGLVFGWSFLVGALLTMGRL